MPTIKSVSAAFLASIALLSLGDMASASLIFDSSIDDTGAGFGTTFNILTVEKPGGAGTATDVETGKVAWNGTNDVYSGGQVDTNPGKTATFSFGTLGLADAEDVNLIWNPAEVGNSPATQVDTLILTIYNTNGTTFWSASLAAPVFHSTATNVGVGGIGFVYRIDDAQAFALNQLLDPLSGSQINALRIGLESSISYVDNGPDHWTINTFDRPAPPPPGCQVDCTRNEIPEPQPLALLTLGLLASAYFRRHQRVR